MAPETPGDARESLGIRIRRPSLVRQAGNRPLLRPQRRVPWAALDAHSWGLLSDVTSWHSAVSVAAVLGRVDPAASNINRLLGEARAVFDLYRQRIRLGTPHLEEVGG